MNTIIIIQARMSSTRLPGKSLKLLAGTPLIGHVINRMKRVHDVDDIVLATSTDASDDPLAAYAEGCGIHVFHGSLANVQKRFFDAATAAGADLIVRVTGDNPFISHELIDEQLHVWHAKQPDYIGYRRCVHGIGAEVFTMDALCRAVKRPDDAYEQEHVTPAFYRDKEAFTTIALDAPSEFCNNELRLTVDTEEELVRAERLFTRYADGNGYVDVREVIAGKI